MLPKDTIKNLLDGTEMKARWERWEVLTMLEVMLNDQTKLKKEKEGWFLACLCLLVVSCFCIFYFLPLLWSRNSVTLNISLPLILLVFFVSGTGFWFFWKWNRKKYFDEFVRKNNEAMFNLINKEKDPTVCTIIPQSPINEKVVTYEIQKFTGLRRVNFEDQDTKSSESRAKNDFINQFVLEALKPNIVVETVTDWNRGPVVSEWRIVCFLGVKKEEEYRQCRP